MKEYKTAANFVRPLPTVERQESVPMLPMEGMLSSDSIHVGAPLAAHHGAHEQTSGMDRSLAWGVRLIPYTIIVMLLALTLTRLAGGSWLLGFVLFASLSLGLYALLDYREHKYSRNGLELHKVTTLRDLKFYEMDLNQERAMLILNAQVKRWEAEGYANERAALEARGRTIEGGVTGPSARRALADSTTATGHDRRAND